MQVLSPSMLIVDDDKSILQSFSKILRKCGYSVDTAENGKLALKKMRNRKYDFIFFDIRLPDIKGTDLLIKAKECIREAVKVMITGFPSLETGIKSLEEGADAYLIKPVQPSQLLSLIESRLSKPSPQCNYKYVFSGESPDFPM